MLERLRASFGDAIYVVRELPRSETREVGAVTFGEDGPVEEYRTRLGPPQLPVGGLAVVRELCSKSGGDHCVEWFGTDAVDWDALPKRDVPVLDRTHDLAAMFPGTAGSLAPPRHVLEHFARLAIDTATPVAYFTCHMWGGDTSDAFAWVWQGDRGAVFYRAVTESAEGDAPMFTQVRGVQVTDAHGTRWIANGDVLTLVLLHFGLLLDSGFWQPHTRSFAWDEFRITG